MIMKKLTPSNLNLVLKKEELNIFNKKIKKPKKPIQSSNFTNCGNRRKLNNTILKHNCEWPITYTFEIN